jgi:hypothetical protein
MLISLFYPSLILIILIRKIDPLSSSWYLHNQASRNFKVLVKDESCLDPLSLTMICASQIEYQ